MEFAKALEVDDHQVVSQYQQTAESHFKSVKDQHDAIAFTMKALDDRVRARIEALFSATEPLDAASSYEEVLARFQEYVAQLEEASQENKALFQEHNLAQLALQDARLAIFRSSSF
ncbi:hypothetical protein DFP72DRAFT_1077347 [Ephemerocybe angulata]|uniref:Uncharacterized protein n=1 Tax=Ephemerocybe angulata TaxID=980116 RepID=A0A8H6HFQ0_9AGAR|nr:hypothetical protein DFP72DRAFT_1077347 [Tulosesus angulatus]